MADVLSLPAYDALRATLHLGWRDTPRTRASAHRAARYVLEAMLAGTAVETHAQIKYGFWYKGDFLTPHGALQTAQCLPAACVESAARDLLCSPTKGTVTMPENALHLLSNVLVSDVLENPDGSPANLVDGLSTGLHKIARALTLLGLADASTPFGAIEALCGEVKEGSTRIAEGLHAIADAIADQGRP